MKDSRILCFGRAESLTSYEEILFCVRQNYLVPSFVLQLLPQLWRDMVLLNFGSFRTLEDGSPPFDSCPGFRKNTISARGKMLRLRRKRTRLGDQPGRAGPKVRFRALEDGSRECHDGGTDRSGDLFFRTLISAPYPARSRWLLEQHGSLFPFHQAG